MHSDQPDKETIRPAPRHVVVTGASGYIGRRLCDLLLASNVAVTALGRHRPALANPNLRYVPWSLGETPDASAFAASGSFPEPDAVIHLAHVWDGSAPIVEDINVTGSLALLRASRQAGVPRFVFGSSIAARPGALNRYGRIKAAIEAELDPRSEIATRIGLVYGGALRGQWATLERLVRLPVLPMLDPWTRVQPVHVDDLCEGLMRAAAPSSGALAVTVLAAKEPVSFGHFLRALARVRHGHRLFLLPVPSWLALVVIDITSRIPGLPRIDRERVLGLAGIRTVDSGDSLAVLGLTLRPLEDGLVPQSFEIRRKLLSEARLLLTYVAGGAPSPGSLRRYVRSVEAAGSGSPQLLRFGPLTTRFPALLRAVEAVGKGGLLARRLDIALRVLENHLAAPPVGLMRALGGLAVTGLIEGILLPVRILSGLVRRS